MTTIKDIARVAGVSVTTVSRALNGYSDVNEKTKQKFSPAIAAILPGIRHYFDADQFGGP